MGKLTIALDFDGVIHLYRQGWHDGTIYDDIHPEFFAWALEAQEQFNLVIFSARGETAVGLADMQEYIEAQYEAWLEQNPEYQGKDLVFSFAEKKPKAWVYVDDRAITFQGSFKALTVESIKAFRPWNVE